MSQHRSILFVAAVIILFASCSKTPEHAKYIPKDAMVVVGINTKELSKKLAWDAIMGSKLLDELKAKDPKNTDAAEGLGNAGIDALNTTFFYYTPAATKEGYSYITALVPLSDAKKWDAYIQKNFPGGAIKEINKRKEAMLDEGLYASWNEELAIVRKAINATGTSEERAIDYTGEEDSLGLSPAVNTAPVLPDANRMSADMLAVFTIKKDNNITQDKRFTKLQDEGDDISFWMNYDVFMKNINSYSGGAMGGLALGNSLWKDAAYTTGINLDKGKIQADMKYYVSKELAEIYSKIGNKNVDQEMIDRLPMQQVNMMATLNISPEGTKAMLDKMGMLGFMSLALMQGNLTADDVFESFTGDMVMVLHDFSMKKTVDSTNESEMYGRKEDVNMDFIFAMKIHKKEKFDKLLNYVKSQGGFTAIDATTYQFAGGGDVYVSIDKGYLAVSNKVASAKGYINGDFKSQARPELVKKEIYGHPMAIFLDIQSLLNGAGAGSSDQDQQIIELSKKTFKDLIINGGDNKKELFAFSGVLNLVNKEENSLLQLLDYSFKVNELNKTRQQQDERMDVPLASDRDTLVRN